MRRKRHVAPITILCTSLDHSPAQFAKETLLSAIFLEGKESDVRDKSANCFRRLLNGKVRAEIGDWTGVHLTSRDVATMAAGEFRRNLELLKLAEPEQLIVALSVSVQLIVNQFRPPTSYPFREIINSEGDDAGKREEALRNRGTERKLGGNPAKHHRWPSSQVA